MFKKFVGCFVSLLMLFVFSGCEFGEKSEEKNDQLTFEQYLQENEFVEKNDQYYLYNEVAFSKDIVSQLYNEYSLSKINRGYIGLLNGNRLVWTSSEKKNITYRFASDMSTAFLTDEQVRNAIREAAARWMMSCDISFREVQSGETFIIGWFSEEPTMDSNKIKYYTLAHSFFPHSNSNYRLELNEICYKRDRQYYNYQQMVGTMTHEFGHILGLAHEHARTDSISSATWASDYRIGGGENYSSYDSASIMDYQNTSDKLSDGDRNVASYLYGTSSNMMVQGDFDADGIKNDFAVYLSTGYVWLIKSMGNYFSVEGCPAPAGYNSIFAGDCNKDGKDDLMMVSDNGWHLALLSDGWEFYGQIAVQIGAGYKTIIGDFDGDGRKNDFAAYSSLGHMYLIKSTGTAFSCGYNTAPAGYSDMFAGDCNKDGKDDLMLVAGNGWHMSIFSDGNKFAGLMAVQIGAGYKTIIGDFDGDGRKNDFAAYSSLGHMYLIKSTGTAFSCGYNTAPAGYNDMYAGDCNKDGKDDLMMVADTGWHISIFSDGSKFIGQMAVQIGAGYKTIVGDFDGDGRKNDFAAYATTGHMYLIKSTGTAFMCGYNTAPIGYNPNKLYAGDCNKDGLDDLNMLSEIGWLSCSLSNGNIFNNQIAIRPW